VIHHVDCGMLSFTDDQLRQKLHDDLGVDTDVPFLSFPDLARSVRDDLAALRSSPLLLKDTPIRGFIYDVHTGRLSEVV
jgi:carbonic anhydrase